MRIILIIILLLTSGIATACDYCNCYLGLDPGYNKNIIGIRNSWRVAEWTPFSTAQRTTHTTHGGSETAGESKLKESFLNTELYIRYSPVSKLRLWMTLPYAINTLTYEGTVERGMAFSDMTLMAMYQLLNTVPADSNSVRHRVFGGGGVKFPTGKSEGGSEVNIPMSHHLYSGTGSTDYLLNLSYIGKFKKLGWNLDASYKLNGESATYYRYGNTLNIVPRIFYETGIKAVKLFPHAGAAYEAGKEDEFKDTRRDETGGEIIWGSAGLDVYLGRYSLTTEFRLPLYHDVGAQMAEDKSVLFTSLNLHF